jgi:general nucleoside transport system permease protein
MRHVVRAERRAHVPVGLAIAAPAIAAAAGLVVFSALVAVLGFSPLALWRLAFAATFGSFSAIVDTIERAAPLMLTGLATVLALRVGFINLGAEGQMIAGAAVALVISAGVLPAPPLAIVPIAIVAGFCAGAILAALVAELKLRLRADDAIVTVLLNVLMLFALQLAAGGTLLSFPELGSSQTLPIANMVDLTGLGHALRAYAEPLIAILACALAFALMNFTIYGLDMRATGGNPVAARFAGVPVEFMTRVVALVSGALAGLAGAGEVVAAAGGSKPALVLGFGYAGIVVAYLAALEPLGVVPAALLVSAVFGGIEAATRSIGLPSALSGDACALLLIAALMAHGAVRYRLRVHRPEETR